MTTKVNQTVKPGIWVERDTSLLLVTGDFTDAKWTLPSSDVYKVFNVLQTRCTVIGVSKTNGNASFIVGHAGGSFAPATGSDPLLNNVDVIAELNAAMPAGYDVALGTEFLVS